MQAFLIEKGSAMEFVGNRTECALLVLLKSWGVHFKKIRDAFANQIVHVYGFSSERKMASLLLRINTGYRLYTKASPTSASTWMNLVTVQPRDTRARRVNINGDGGLLPTFSRPRPPHRVPRRWFSGSARASWMRAAGQCC